MFNILFKDMEDVNHYLPIEYCYLEKIKKTFKEKNVILENEMYPFLKIILFCLGTLFKHDFKKNLIITEENKNEILEYFNETFIQHIHFILEKYDNIKRYYSIYLNNINTTSINLDIESNNNNNFINNENFKDYLELIECFYYLLLNFITDVSNGKEYYSMIEKNLNKRINNKEEINKFEEICLILILKNIKENDYLSKTLIFSLIEYICGKILEDLNNNSNYFYDILISYNLLIIDDENLQEKSMKLFAEIFMEEIKIDNFLESFLIKINDLINRNNNFELILPLLMYISLIYKDENENVKIKVLNCLSNILNKYSDKNLYFNFLNLNVNYIQKYESDFYQNMFNNFNIFNYSDSEKNLELVKQYFNFYNTFLLFLNTNFHSIEIGNEIYTKNIFYIYKLEILSQNSIDFILYIPFLIKQLIYYLKVNLTSNTNNSYLIYKNLSFFFKELIKSDFQNFSYVPYLSYYINLFILIEIKKIKKLAISLSNIHNKIISETKNLEQNYSNLIKEIEINELITNDYNESQIQKLENDLINNFKICQNFNINKMKYIQIMEIIYSKFYGKSINLFYCLEPELNSLERGFDKISNSNQTDDISIAQNTSNSFLKKIEDRSDISTELNNNINNNNDNNNENQLLNESLPSIQSKFFKLNHHPINISINNDNEDENIKY